MTTIIAALTRGHVIGKDGRIPWDLPEDRKLFRERTIGHAVIMGRKTWESLPERYRPLPDRQNIVLSSRPVREPGVDRSRTLDDAISCAHSYDCEPFLIGGARVYEEALALGLVDTMHLTWVEGSFVGDTFFPDVDWDRWEMTDSIALNGAIATTYRKV